MTTDTATHQNPAPLDFSRLETLPTRELKPDAIYYTELFLDEVFRFIPGARFTGYEVLEPQPQDPPALTRFMLYVQAEISGSFKERRQIRAAWEWVVGALSLATEVRAAEIGARAPDAKQKLTQIDLIFSNGFGPTVELHLRCAVQQ